MFEVLYLLIGCISRVFSSQPKMPIRIGARRGCRDEQLRGWLRSEVSENDGTSLLPSFNGQRNGGGGVVAGKRGVEG
jgi:hypothetical protein